MVVADMLRASTSAGGVKTTSERPARQDGGSLAVRWYGDQKLLVNSLLVGHDGIPLNRHNAWKRLPALRGNMRVRCTSALVAKWLCKSILLISVGANARSVVRVAKCGVPARGARYARLRRTVSEATTGGAQLTNTGHFSRVRYDANQKRCFFSPPSMTPRVRAFFSFGSTLTRAAKHRRRWQQVFPPRQYRRVHRRHRLCFAASVNPSAAGETAA